MSLLNTKPRYFPTAIATESGWINPVTKELLVSVGGLKSKLELEEATRHKTTDVFHVIGDELNNTSQVAPVKEENNMNDTTPETKTRKPYAPRKPKVIGEQTEQILSTGTQLIGEVVEYTLEPSANE